MTRRPIVEVLEDVDFQYPGNLRHLYRIPAGLKLFPSEAWSLLGVSGSGKTTLMALLACFRRFSSGRIRYCFQGSRSLEVSAENWTSVVGPSLWHRLGFALQRPELIASLSVVSNLEIATGDRKAPLFREEEWKSITSSRPSQISGGQTQRLGLMRAFGSGQSLVFLDEPTNNLDQSNRREAIAYVQKQRLGRALVAVSHDAEFLAGLNADQSLQTEAIQQPDGTVLRTLIERPRETTASP